MLWTLPLVGAVLGWATNWLAVKMLFRPRQPFGIGRWTIQGLIPSRKAVLAVSVAQTIDEKLVNSADFEDALKNDATREAVKQAVWQYVNALLRGRLSRTYAMLEALGKQRELDELPNVITRQVVGSLPALATQVSEKLKETLDLQALIAKRVYKFSDEELERCVLDIAGAEFKAIEAWGMAIGAAIGGLQWLFLWVSSSL